MPEPSTQSQLYIQTTGPDGAPTIVFLHGGGGGGWMWQPVVAQLPGYHCLVPDLPEHGQSASVKPFTMAGAAAGVAELIRSRAHGGKAHVVGLSEGAQTLVALLSAAPELVNSAIISSALLRSLPGASLYSPGVLAWSYRLGVAPLKNVDWWIRLNMKYAAAVPESHYADFKRDFQSMTEQGWTNVMLANQRFRMPGGLERVTAPALVVVGSKEYAAMKQSARDLAAALPNARACCVTLGAKASLGQEHNWALNAPELFAATVRAWIEGKPLPAALQAV